MQHVCRQHCSHPQSPSSLSGHKYHNRSFFVQYHCTRHLRMFHCLKVTYTEQNSESCIFNSWPPAQDWKFSQKCSVAAKNLMQMFPKKLSTNLCDLVVYFALASNHETGSRRINKLKHSVAMYTTPKLRCSTLYWECFVVDLSQCSGRVWPQLMEVKYFLLWLKRLKNMPSTHSAVRKCRKSP